MRKKIALPLILIAAVAIIFMGFGFLSSYIGWYGYRKWEGRKMSSSVSEAKARGTFVKRLNYISNPDEMNVQNFEIFIEKGFRYGKHTQDKTILLTNTLYPYQLSFNYQPGNYITVRISKTDLEKFDSSNSNWGYLAMPSLNDTITLELFKNGKGPTFIKILPWSK